MNPSDLIFVLLPIVLIAAFVWQRFRINQIRDEYANDPDVEVETSFLSFSMRTRGQLRPASVVPAGGGKNNPPRWELRTTVQLPQSGLSLSLSREGMLGGFRELVGLKDIHVGDDAFDRAFTVRGSDADAIARLLSQDSSRREVYALFDLRVNLLKIDGGGGVFIRADRRTMDGGAVAKAMLLQALALLDQLEDRAASSAHSAFR